jgi:hypothetical protein
MKRMATPNALQAHPDTFRCAMDFNGLAHIDRASGVKAARGRQQWRNQALVPGEELNEDLPHRINRRFTSA